MTRISRGIRRGSKIEKPRASVAPVDESSPDSSLESSSDSEEEPEELRDAVEDFHELDDVIFKPCERMKLVTRQYSAIWHIDNGTQCKRFMACGRQRGRTFEIIAPYNHQQAGIVEAHGDNAIKSAMVVDTKLPEKL